MKFIIWWLGNMLMVAGVFMGGHYTMLDGILNGGIVFIVGSALQSMAFAVIFEAQD